MIRGSVSAQPLDLRIMDCSPRGGAGAALAPRGQRQPASVPAHPPIPDTRSA